MPTGPIAAEIMSPHFQNLFSDSWGILEVLVADSSPIDLSRLPLEDEHDAYCFVKSYGFDCQKKDDFKVIEKIRDEAVSFLQRILIDTLEPDYVKLTIPAEIRKMDILQLLLCASGNTRSHNQKWACAVLRIMHTLAHVVSDLSMHFFPSILDQILDPFYQHIHNDGQQMWLGKEIEHRIPLVDFQVKAGKDRDSALLKLLHKAENVAADLFDRIGVRFVTQDRLDAVLVLHYLREFHLVAFPNVKPSRSVNTLIDINKFRRHFRDLYLQQQAGKLTQAEFEKALRQYAQFHDNLTQRQVSHLFKRNPYTSGQYRSMQFTVRQLVSLVNPLYACMDQIEEQLELLHPSQREHPLIREPLEHARPQYYFFFPYEIQIVDVETHQNNMQGHASHDTYKMRQLKAARKRVLGKLLKKKPIETTEKGA